MAVRNAGLSWVNYLKTAAGLTASSQAAGLPVANLTDDHLAVAFRSADADPLTISFDLGSVRPIGIVGLYGMNHASADWRVTLSAVSQGGTDVLDTGTIDADIKPGYRQTAICPEGGLEARYGRIILTDTSDPALGYHQIGIAWVGDLFQGIHNLSRNAAPEWSDPSVISQSRGGQIHVDVREKFRTFHFELRGLTREETYTKAQEIDRVAGIGGNVVCVPEPGGLYQNYEMILGRQPTLSAAPRWAHRHHSKQFQLEERL